MHLSIADKAHFITKVILKIFPFSLNIKLLNINYDMLQG